MKDAPVRRPAEALHAAADPQARSTSATRTRATSRRRAATCRATTPRPSATRTRSSSPPSSTPTRRASATWNQWSQRANASSPARCRRAAGGGRRRRRRSGPRPDGPPRGRGIQGADPNRRRQTQRCPAGLGRRPLRVHAQGARDRLGNSSTGNARSRSSRCSPTQVQPSPRPLPTPRQGGLQVGTAADRRNPQPAQAPPQPERARNGLREASPRKAPLGGPRPAGPCTKMTTRQRL